MSDRPSELRSGLPCTHCGRSLFPVPIGPDVTLHCKNGHGFEIQELLATHSAKVGTALEKLITEWESQVRRLEGTAEDARSNGYTDIADLFVRRAERLERKIDNLRSAFRKDESSKLIAVPPALIRPGPPRRR